MDFVKTSYGNISTRRERSKLVSKREQVRYSWKWLHFLVASLKDYDTCKERYHSCSYEVGKKIKLTLFEQAIYRLEIPGKQEISQKILLPQLWKKSFLARLLRNLARFLRDLSTECIFLAFFLWLLQMRDFLQDFCKYLATNIFPAWIMQEMYRLAQGLQGLFYLVRFLQEVRFEANLARFMQEMHFLSTRETKWWCHIRTNCRSSM